jgi:hypothetical protein
MNKALISDKKTAGFVVAALGSMLVYKIWNTNQTLPADFLLGAFSAWLIRTAVAFFKSVEELQNNIDE